MSQRLTALEADLCKVGSSDPVTFASTILNAYTQNPHLKQHSAYHRHVSIILSHLFLLLVFEFAGYLLPCQHSKHFRSSVKIISTIWS